LRTQELSQHSKQLPKPRSCLLENGSEEEMTTKFPLPRVTSWENTGSFRPIIFVRLFVIVLVVLCCIAPTVPPVLAHPPTSPSRSARVPFPALTAQPLAQPLAQHSQRWTFREAGYGEQTAQTMYGSLSYFFPVPSGKVPTEGSELRLRFHHSPLLVPDRSTMTVLVNGQSMASTFLNESNANEGLLIAPLPVEGFAGRGFFVQIVFLMRLTRDECEDPQNPALWTTIQADSQVILETRPTSSADLSHLDRLFAPPAIQPNAPPPAPLPVVMPSDPQSEELEAAGLVAMQLGRWAQWDGRDPQQIQAVRPPIAADQSAVFVGRGGAFALADSWGGLQWNGTTFATSAGPVSSSHGVLAVRQPATPTLLVSGETPAAVRIAAESLLHQSARMTPPLLAGPYALVTGRSPAQSFGRPWQPWQQGAASFARLGETADYTFGGPGLHVLDLRFERPPEWDLHVGSVLELAIETSPALKGDTSWVAVSVNGVAVGTRQLRPGSPPDQPYRFDLPADLLTKGLAGEPVRHLSLQVQLYLDLPYLGCTQLSPESVWARLLSRSAWLLPHASFPGLDLGRFPTPLMGQPDTPLRVVLPDQPDDADLAAGLQMMTALGRWTTSIAAPLPELVTASQVDATMREQSNLIVLGNPQHNSISAALASVAPPLFERPNPVAYRLEPDEPPAYLRLAPSPWARERVVLVVLADSSEGVHLAAFSLAQRETLAQIRGSEVAVFNDLPPQQLTAAVPPPTPPDTLNPRVEVSLVEQLPAWQVVGAVLLGMFIASVVFLLIARYRRTGAS
jgi:hypothetical protein